MEKEDKRVKAWSVLAKPLHDCNLNCQYCYEKPMRDKYSGIYMPYEMVDHILKLATDHSQNITWIWHGGEPTLMGTKWYKDVQELFYKYADKSKITQHMQSNGTKLNKDWADLSENYGINIGVSYDGVSQKARVGSDNNTLVEDNISEYQSSGGKTGGITVITKDNYEKQIEIYNLYKYKLKTGGSFNHLFSTEGSKKFELEITSDMFVEGYVKFAKYWLHDTTEEAVDERTVATMIELNFGQVNKICTYSDCRRNWIGINPTGIVHPCDRATPKQYEVGNIMDYSSINELYNSEPLLLYYYEIEKRLKTHCVECGYIEYCRGACNASHMDYAGNGSGVNPYICELVTKKFNRTYEILRDIDIHTNQYHKVFMKSILDNSFLTLNEIKDYLKEKGLNTDLQIDLNGKQIFNSQEFKIFRFFNPLRSPLGITMAHIDTFTPNYTYDDLITNKLSEEIKQSRRTQLEKMFNKNCNEILKLLS